MKTYYLFTKRKDKTAGNKIDFEEDYEDSYPDWQQKAERLQARRWRKIKHQLV